MTKRSQVIQLRCTQKHKETICNFAERFDISISNFCSNAVLEKIEKIKMNDGIELKLNAILNEMKNIQKKDNVFFEKLYKRWEDLDK